MKPEDLAHHPVVRELARCGRMFHRWQWSLASSSNFSALVTEDAIAISRSGVDKASMRATDFLLVDLYGRPLAGYAGLKPSAETELHCHIYRLSREKKLEVGAVLHTHAKFAVHYSRRHAQEGRVVFQGWEMQKIFEGVFTHETTTVLPIFPNSQTMADITQAFDTWLEKNPWPPAYLITGHGVYAWGKTVLHARLKLEALEYLFELKFMEECYAKPTHHLP